MTEITLHFIGFELLNSDKDYRQFFDKLIELGARRVLEHQWILRGEFISPQILRLLQPLVAPHDKLFVVEVCGGFSSLNAIDLDREGLTKGLGVSS
jgi:hypothetical protein